MKKTYILILGALVALTSCGMIAQGSSSTDEHRFQDGIYSSTPSFRSKEEKNVSREETEALVSKTKESPIYLFGDRKDTIMIPDHFSARIQYDQKVGGTVVTVGENPYDWRWDLENRYGYWYEPYSIGSSWYWSRHYCPFYSPYYSPYWSAWSYSPWRYCSFYDPWYYDPWYYDTWHYGGYWGGYYAGYWGWHDPWHHHHHHHHHHHGWYDPHPPVTKPPHSGGGGSHNRYHGPRTFTERERTYAGPSSQTSGISGRTGISRTSGGGTMRGSMSVGNRTNRAASVTGRSSSSASRSSSSASRSSSSPTYRRPSSSGSSSSYERGPSHGSSSSYSRSSSRESGSSTYERSSSSSYSRGSSYNSDSYSRSSSSGSYSRSSSSGGGGYSRSSSGGYRR